VSRTSRREFLLLGVAAGAASATPPMSVSLLPIYNKKYPPVAQEFLDAASAALEKTYIVKVNICEPEFYEGACDGNAVLQFLSTRSGRVMAAISAPVRAPVRFGVKTEIMDVSGWADIPNDDRERPRGSVITTFGLWNITGEATAALGVVAIHELGHNFGAWDCRDNACYMNDKIHVDRGLLARGFCQKHKDLLWQYLR